MWCLNSCGRPGFVCEVVLVPYVDAVVAESVMRVVCTVVCVTWVHAERGWECEGDGNAGVGGGGGCVVVVSARHIGGTRGSGVVSSAADVLGMCVVRGMSGVDWVCEMCMCLTLDCVGGEVEWLDERIGFGLYQSCGTKGSVGRVSVSGLQWCGWWRWVGGLDQCLKGWGGVMSVRVVSPDSLCRWQVQVSVYNNIFLFVVIYSLFRHEAGFAYSHAYMYN